MNKKNEFKRLVEFLDRKIEMELDKDNIEELILERAKYRNKYYIEKMKGDR